MTKWGHLPQNNGKIKLKRKNFTLLDAFDVLIKAKDPLVKYISEDEIHSLTEQSEFDVIQPYIPLKIYRTEEDKKNDIYNYFLFANHGPIYYCEGEVLERYKLNEINYFWNLQLPTFENQPKEFIYHHYFEFSNDPDALDDWSASFNYEDIFSTFGLNGADGGFAGFVGLIIHNS
jgi:hypothetical protein